MGKCEKQIATIGGCTFEVPFYYQRIEALPSDPPGAVPYAVATPSAQCFFIGYEIEDSKRIPMVQAQLLSGIRQFLGENQGIIEVEANGKYAYSIVKTLMEPHGVQYTLTFQEIIEDKIIFIQGSFEEDGTTGIRDATILNVLMQGGQVGTKENPLEGWARDPYDENVKTGALMNLSELREYDPLFSGSPLMVCRELVDFLIECSNNR